MIDTILNKPTSSRSYAEFSLLSNYIRKYIIEMVYSAASGHLGGPLGLADIFTMLYFKHLNVSSKDSMNEKRDYLLLSNGHVCAVRYASMALAGFLDYKELQTFRKLGSRLQGHPSTKFFPQVENSSGSLGQGLSNASGLALGLRLQKKKNYVYVCLSDGECQEGMTWEAAMAASHYKNSRLIAFIDLNGVQIDGFTKNIMDVGNLKQKFESFGWLTKELDGHNHKKIDDAFTWAKTNSEEKPRVILFKTILGKDVDFMEDNPSWHGVPPKEAEYKQAIKLLNEKEQIIINQIKLN